MVMTTDVAFAQAFQQQKTLQYDNNIYFVVYELFQMSLQMIQLVISVINIGRMDTRSKEQRNDLHNEIYSRLRAEIGYNIIS